MIDNVTKTFRLNSNFGILNKLVMALEVPLLFTCQGGGLWCWSFCPLCLLSWELLAAEGVISCEGIRWQQGKRWGFPVMPLYLLISSLQIWRHWRTQCFSLTDWNLPSLFFIFIFYCFFCIMEKLCTFSVLGPYSVRHFCTWMRHIVWSNIEDGIK